VLRIVIVRLDNLGDHVLGSGVLPALRALHPDARLELVVPEAIADLYLRCPLINDVLTLPHRDTYLRDAAHLRTILNSLQAHGQAGLVLNPRFGEDHYLAGPICRSMAADCARVVGYRQSSTPYTGYDANGFYGELVDAPDGLHASRYAGLMSAYLGASAAAEPAVWFAPHDLAAVQARYRLDDRPFVAVGCGASFNFKRPALDTYCHIVNQIALRFRRRVVLIGLAADRAAAQAIFANAPPGTSVDSTLGELSLTQLAALMSLAELYVGPDAGPLHIAAAVGTAVVELGWAPIDYPTTSRGDGTGGKCWAPWTRRAITVRPDATRFAQRVRAPGFQQQPITDLPTADIDLALAATLGNR
jgi:heptosyltransferase-2